MRTQKIGRERGKGRKEKGRPYCNSDLGQLPPASSDLSQLTLETPIHLSIGGQNEPHIQKPDLAWALSCLTGKPCGTQQGTARVPRHHGCRLGWPSVTRARTPTLLRTRTRPWAVSPAESRSLPLSLGTHNGAHTMGLPENRGGLAPSVQTEQRLSQRCLVPQETWGRPALRRDGALHVHSPYAAPAPVPAPPLPRPTPHPEGGQSRGIWGTVPRLRSSCAGLMPNTPKHFIQSQVHENSPRFSFTGVSRSASTDQSPRLGGGGLQADGSFWPPASLEAEQDGDTWALSLRCPPGVGVALAGSDPTFPSVCSV